MASGRGFEPPSLNEDGSSKVLDAVQVSTQDSGAKGLIAQFSENPYFTAGFGLAGLGAGLAVARKGVQRGASLLKRRLLVDVEINNKDESYPWFLYWMTMQQRAANESAAVSSKRGVIESLLRRFTPGMHHLSIETQKISLPNGAVQTHFSLVPGPGRHILRYKNAFFLVERMRETKLMDKPWETVTLTTLYSHRHIFEDLFREAHLLAQRSTEGKTIVYHSKVTSWEPFGEPRRKRALSSVILDEGMTERILSDVKSFLDSEKWYHDRGIPYRRGYLLHGPPGTGKSSFIQALAGELDYNIAMLNLAERGLTDDRLNHVLSKVPKRTFVILEDVDAAFVAPRAGADMDGYRGAHISFSGLLNALDGVASAEERILFLTTNHVERLDAALIRPGRVDMTIRLGDATRYQVSQFWERFYGDMDTNGVRKAKFLRRLEELSIIELANEGKGIGQEPRFRTSTAALQGLFLRNKDDMEGVVGMAEVLLPDGVAASMTGKADSISAGSA